MAVPLSYLPLPYHSFGKSYKIPGFVSHIAGQIQICKFRYFKGWAKPDGSFSESGCTWPWSCSVDLCYKIYNPASIEILRGVGYTTLGTTVATSLYDTTEDPDLLLDDYAFAETSPPIPILYETTPAPKFEFLFESTQPDYDLFVTSTSSGKLNKIIG